MPAFAGMTLIKASLAAGLVQLVVELDPQAVGVAEENLQRRVVVHELLLEGNLEPLELRLHLGPAGGVERDVVEASGASLGRRDVFLQADVQHRMAARVEPPARPPEVRAEAFFQPQHLAVEAQRLVDLRGRDDDIEVIDQTDCHGAPELLDRGKPALYYGPRGAAVKLARTLRGRHHAQPVFYGEGAIAPSRDPNPMRESRRGFPRR